MMEHNSVNDSPWTEDEKIVRDLIFRLTTVGNEVPCDDDLIDFEPNLPSWYDDVKYKRGQKYFNANRPGIFNSNMVSLICLLGQRKGLMTLCSTGRSSTAETARKRYVSTVLHTLSWYEHDLTPGSASWESLLRVRKLHLNASRSSQNRQEGKINQFEMVVTQFGFMGFALIRPEVFNIRNESEEDLQGFVHLWAVLGYMLGIRDEFNFCLLPLSIVTLTSQVFLRYFILPGFQLESPIFKRMTLALLDGLKPFVPFTSYEVQMFTAKRAACIPGYQYNVDCKREKLCRSIFTEAETQRIVKCCASELGYEYAQIVLFAKVPIYTFIEDEVIVDISSDSIDSKKQLREDIVIESGVIRPMEEEFRCKVRQVMELKDSTRIVLTLVDYETEWERFLNDSRFATLSSESQSLFVFREKIRKLSEYKFFHYTLDWLVSLLMWRFRRHMKSY